MFQYAQARSHHLSWPMSRQTQGHHLSLKKRIVHLLVPNTPRILAIFLKYVNSSHQWHKRPYGKITGWDSQKSLEGVGGCLVATSHSWQLDTSFKSADGLCGATKLQVTDYWCSACSFIDLLLLIRRHKPQSYLHSICHCSHTPSLYLYFYICMFKSSMYLLIEGEFVTNTWSQETPCSIDQSDR